MNEDEVQRLAGDLMIAVGAKPMRNGSFTLHFDNEGLFQSVEVKFTRKVRTAARPPLGTKQVAHEVLQGSR